MIFRPILNGREKKIILSHLLPAPEKHRQPGAARRAPDSPRELTRSGSHCPAVSSLSCLSSPPPRRSARPPSAAALSRPGRSCPPQAAGAPCTWRSRAGAASRPARSGASRSAAARSVAAAASRRPRRPAWTRRLGRSRLSGKASRWGSRCRRSPCRSCRTPTSPISGRGPSGSPLASSCSTCGRSASSSASLLVVSPWPPTTTGQQISGTLLPTRNRSNHRSSLRSQNHQVLTCLKVIQLK